LQISRSIIVSVLRSTLRQSTPITLGALCGIFCERSGIVNIAIEGMMLMSAFTGYYANVYLTALPLWLRLIVSIIVAALTGGLTSAIHAVLCIRFKVDHIISGTVINILAIGLTGYFYVHGVQTEGKLQPIHIPLLADVPIVGEVLFNNGPITYMALILVFAVSFVLWRTTWGLRMRAVGEHPRAADTVGINVYRMQYTNVIIGGCIAGLGGAFLTLEAVGSFERLMTNGRGFIALAAMIFGKWTPFGSLGAALLFGFANALQTQLQFTGGINIPHQFIGMLPYLLTVIVLAGFVGRARPPANVGKPYEVE
jgi:ABC-type uncharacterized transport system permease subunit